MAFSLRSLLRRSHHAVDAIDLADQSVPPPRKTVIPAALLPPPPPNLFLRLYHGEFMLRQMQVLGGLFLLLLLLIAGLLFQDRHQSNANTTAIAAASEMRMLSQRLAKAASLAVQGQTGAFAQLREARQGFERILESLRQSAALTGNPADGPPQPHVVPALEALGRAWAPLRQNAELLGNEEKGILALTSNLLRFESLMPELLAQTARLNSLMLQKNGNSREAGASSQLPLLAQRMETALRNLPAQNGPDSVRTVQGLGSDAQMFRDLLQALAQGNSVMQIVAPVDSTTSERLLALDQHFSACNTAIRGVIDNLPAWQTGRQASLQMLRDAESVMAAADQLTQAYLHDPDSEQRTLLLLVAALLAVLVLVLLVRLYLRDIRRRAEQAEQERQQSERVNQRTQEAILRLMDELSLVASGDLTVTATVSEEVTGAIADSINWTIEELRGLVIRIHDVTERVDTATRITRDTSGELLAAAGHQSEQIQSAGRSVLDVARAMHAVSGHAALSAQVAQQSLAAADKGQQAVQETITGMQGIRMQIQETAKRIKRLGESSQEIGEIVELIADITEQTNVLAVNAAIQAASAGEAGRGFTVVAEEVQRLAERSSEATRQIATLVRTIQADTQDAVAAMEHSTQDVVEGTRRSDVAGQALAEITTVTHKLSSLVSTISTATQSRSLLAKQVAVQMQEILRITEQTTAGTRRTASAVEELAHLATDLKSSVSGFRVTSS